MTYGWFSPSIVCLDFEPRNILVIDFGQLGDVILSLPALRAIIEHFPNAKKSVLVGSACAEIVRMSRLFDEVIDLDRVRLLRGSKFSSSVEIIQFAFAMHRRKFDFVIDLHSLPETNLLGFFTGAKHRLFANRESRSIDFLSNFQPKPPIEDKLIPLSENYVRVLKPMGINLSSEPVDLVPSEAEVNFVNELLPEKSGSENHIVGLNVGAGHPSRRWKLENFRELTVDLLRRGGVTPVLIIGPEEKPLYEKIIASFPAETRIVSSLTLPQLTVLFRRLSVLVSSDTGPMHLAAVLGTPIVLLLYRESPTRFLPLTDDLTALKYTDIDDVKVDAVADAILEKLADKNSQE